MSFELAHTEVSELTDLKTQVFMLYYDKKNIFTVNNAVVEDELIVNGTMRFQNLYADGTSVFKGHVEHLTTSSFGEVTQGDTDISGVLNVMKNSSFIQNVGIGMDSDKDSSYILTVSGESLS